MSHILLESSQWKRDSFLCVAVIIFLSVNLQVDYEKEENRSIFE